MSVRIDSTVCFHTLSDDIERPLTFSPGFFLTSRCTLCPLGVPLDAATIYPGPTHLVRLTFCRHSPVDWKLIKTSFSTVILFTMADLRPDSYASSLFIVASVNVLVQWVIQGERLSISLPPARSLTKHPPSGLAMLSASMVRQFAIASLVCVSFSFTPLPTPQHH